MDGVIITSRVKVIVYTGIQELVTRARVGCMDSLLKGGYFYVGRPTKKDNKSQIVCGKDDPKF